MTENDLTVEEMLEIQREFEKNFFDANALTLDQRTEWVKDFSMHTIDQSDSLLNELNWKEHEPNDPVEYDKVLEQLVDIQKYVMAMAVVLNVHPDEFREKYHERTQEIEDRYEQSM